MERRTRRDVLGSIAGAAALAGCSESVSTDEESFKNVAVEETELIIEVADGAEGNLAIINPDGELFAEADRTPGETRVTFELGVDYTPGEYEIALVEDDKQIADTSIELRPELEIVEVGIGANHPDRMPESLGHTADDESFLTVRNSGSGPTAIQKLEIEGDVPNPTDLQASESGIFDESAGQGEREKVTLDSDSEKTIFSNSLPFTFEGDGVDCQEDQQEGKCLITITGSNIPDIQRRFRVEYPGAAEYDGCRPKIVGRVE